MTKYIKRPIPIEAHQWFKNGDHPDDGDCTPEPWGYVPEGLVVRRYKHMGGNLDCRCGRPYKDHGTIFTLESGVLEKHRHVVCPGDWIITGVRGERYPCKPDIFAETYTPAPESADGG